MLNPGIKGSASVAVTAANTAAAMGSGELNVFATPPLPHWLKKPVGRALPRSWTPAAAPLAPSWNWPTTPPHPLA